MSEPPVRVLIVDDHALVREGLKARLASVSGVSVMGECADADATLAHLARHEVDVVLLEVGLRSSPGVELTRRIAEVHPQAAVLVLSMHNSLEYALAAMAAGARGYLLKDSPPAQMIHAIFTVAAGGAAFSAPVAQRLFSSKQSDSALSDREQEVLAFLARGMASKVIARQLDISVRTVESHRQSIKRKLQLDGQAELIRFAIERYRS